MKSKLLVVVTLIFLACVPGQQIRAAEVADMMLESSAPAERWEDALIGGNGRQGEIAFLDAPVPSYATVKSLKSQKGLHADALVLTTGFHTPGDGGDALYRIRKASKELEPNGADMIALANGLVATLQERKAVNYRMFGALGDGKGDDGVQIKLAHEYAGKHQIPIINLSGEFWIRETNNIPITTSVSWGKTIFHIDERHNSRSIPRFVVKNDEPEKDLSADAKLKEALVRQIRPGVQIIPELADYAGHMVTVMDRKDILTFRSAEGRGVPRTEFFYVEEEGRIIGDIAWEFKDFTSIKATPCNDNYLIIEGGRFYLSDDMVEGGKLGYRQFGFDIRRSRTIVREQWMGVEKGKREVPSKALRVGFYTLNNVYDVTLENIRCRPWIAGYSIGGNRMLNCTFRNLTAESGKAWGVIGTNQNKNLRIENCRLNRIDVHFHAWNLYISDCIIGTRGITVTGGGDLFVENTTVHCNQFIHFRRDYGSRWDGRVRIRGCTLKPNKNDVIQVLHYLMNLDYMYPIGYARSISIEDMTIDYSNTPDNNRACWIMYVPQLKSVNSGSFFFPRSIEFKDIRVKGREKGVRLLSVPHPSQYSLDRKGSYDETGLTANSTLSFDNVQLESLTPAHPADTRQVHLLIGGTKPAQYKDGLGLYPTVRFKDCDNVSAYFENCAASAVFERCSINTVWAPSLRGELVFSDCRFRPNVKKVLAKFYAVDSTLGTRFTNCTVHAPAIKGTPQPGIVNRVGFLELNGAVKHYHLNTTLGNEILKDCKSKGIVLTPEFVQKLKTHHALEQ